MKIAKKKIPQKVVDSIIESLGRASCELEFHTEKGVTPKYWLINRRDWDNLDRSIQSVWGYSSLKDMTWVLEEEGKLCLWSVFDNTGKHSLFTIKQATLGLEDADF